LLKARLTNKITQVASIPQPAEIVAQRLKPARYCGIQGTAEAAPFQNYGVFPQALKPRPDTKACRGASSPASEARPWQIVFAAISSTSR
jgi:hypothetical protein